MVSFNNSTPSVAHSPQQTTFTQEERAAILKILDEDKGITQEIHDELLGMAFDSGVQITDDQK